MCALLAVVVINVESMLSVHTCVQSSICRALPQPCLHVVFCPLSSTALLQMGRVNVCGFGSGWSSR